VTSDSIRGCGGLATLADMGADRPADLVDRVICAPPTGWVADLTCLRTSTGWVYVAFAIDGYSRMVVGGNRPGTCAPIWPSMRRRRRHGGVN
jgi:transposase InsO family protein